MYHALYVFTLLFRKLFSHIPGIIEGYSLWINSYTNNYGICRECSIAMARSKGDSTGIFQCYAGYVLFQNNVNLQSECWLGHLLPIWPLYYVKLNVICTANALRYQNIFIFRDIVLQSCKTYLIIYPRSALCHIIAVKNCATELISFKNKAALRIDHIK